MTTIFLCKYLSLRMCVCVCVYNTAYVSNFFFTYTGFVLITKSLREFLRFFFVAVSSVNYRVAKNHIKASKKRRLNTSPRPDSRTTPKLIAGHAIGSIFVSIARVNTSKVVENLFRKFESKRSLIRDKRRKFRSGYRVAGPKTPVTRSVRISRDADY